MKDTIVRILTDERDQARKDSTEIAGKFTKACTRIAALEAVIREEHGGRNHEPECPLCAILLTSDLLTTVDGG